MSLAGDELCFAPQSIREAWNVPTRPVQDNGYGLSSADAERAVARLLAVFKLLDDGPDVFTAWRDLVVRYVVIGKNTHDANLVASAISHGATHLLTFNERDFRRYSEITMLTI